MLLLSAWSDVWLIADFVGFVLAGAVVAWEWNRRTITNPVIARVDTHRV
jgi:hypothetical protein